MPTLSDVSWRNRACCVEENFELLWCTVMEAVFT